MIHAPANEKTLVPSQGNDFDGTMIGNRTIEGTMIEHNTGTLVPHGRRGRITDDDDLTDNLGTMVINSDGEEDADSTMKRKKFSISLTGVAVAISVGTANDRCFYFWHIEIELLVQSANGGGNRWFPGHQTAEGQSSKSKYRPLFLDHFEKKDAEKLNSEMALHQQSPSQVSSPPAAQPIAMTPEEQKRFESNLQRQLNQISAGIHLSFSISYTSFVCFFLYVDFCYLSDYYLQLCWFIDFVFVMGGLPVFVCA